MEEIQPEVRIHIAEPFKELLTSHYRYKLYWGGRAGGKSYAFADSVLLKARSSKIFVACVREVQNSIKDSVYKLLKDRAEAFGFADYVFYEDRIENTLTGSKIVFKGLKDQNSQNIKSLEGVDICWIEEGQSITKGSWEILDPTIRKIGSEIWVSMNREQESDPIWKAIAGNQDFNTLVKRVNYTENPYCPEEMRYLAERCKKENMEDYAHIWLGEPVAQGNTKLISAKDVREAMINKLLTSTSPLIIGVDVARYGDDNTVFCYRRGRLCVKIVSYHGLSVVDVANRVTADIKDMKPARVFIDIGGVGGGVYDLLSDRGFSKIVRGINFGSKATLSDRYFNKRAEMWGEANEWLKQELPVQIPNDDILFDDLTSVNKKFDSRGRLQLESKDDVKKRIGRSPDKADAFVLTFASPVFDNGYTKLYATDKMSIESLFAESTKRRDDSW